MVQFDAETLATHRRLLARLAAGDAEALQILFLEFSAVVHGVVRRVLEDPEDAREAVKNTFIKAWRQAASYHPEHGEVASWLVFIARRVAVDRVRQGARRRLLYENLHKQHSSEKKSSSPGAKGKKGNVQKEAPLVNRTQLSEPQRKALELAFFCGCSQKEIASVLQTPVGNVKDHLREGLVKLRPVIPVPQK